MSLATVGTVSYNGHVFNEKTQTVSIDGRPQYDAAGRTIVYTVYTINVKTIIHTAGPDYDTGPTLEDIRRKLLSPGGQLRYEDKGFGDFIINVSTVKDVVWGPKPQLLKWRTIGSSAACEVEWSCEVAIPECTTATYQFALMEVNYRLNFAIDESGYTRRTYSGFLRVPQTRATQTTRTLAYTADQFREQIVPALPVGFRRTTRDFTIDESKCRLDFTIIDEQMPENIPPPGIVLVEADHSVENQRPIGTSLWIGTLTATYEVARGVPRARAWEAFFALAKDRILGARTSSRDAQASTEDIIPLRLRLSEPEIYGKKAAAFSFTYSFVSSLRTILAESGLWRQPPGSNYGTWAASMVKEGVFNPRGSAQLRLNPGDDAIVDLCAQRVVKLTAGGQLQALRTRAFTPFFLRCPPPERSFILYHNELNVESLDGVAVHVPLPDSKITIKRAELKTDADRQAFDRLVNQGRNAGLPGDRQIQNNTNTFQIPYASGKTAVIQQVTKPVVYITLRGFAMRACYLIQPPVLLNIGGFTAFPANGPGNGFTQWQHSNYGLPVVAARWSLRYVLTGVPAIGFGVLGNPLGGG